MCHLPSVCLLVEILIQGIHIFWLGYLFIWAIWAVLTSCIICKYFYHYIACLLVDVSICCAKPFRFISFWFYLFCLRGPIQENISVIDIACSVNVLFYEFIISSVKFVFKPFWVCFYIWCQGMFLSYSFTCSCPVFLALLEEIIFSALYVLASFVID